VKSAKTTHTLVAQASQPAVSQPLSRSVNGKSMAFFIQNDAAKSRPERPQHDSPGQRPGFAATVAIKRCKRATILLLTQRHFNVVAQASQPAVGKPSFGSQVSKPACRVFSTTHSNVFAPHFSWGFSRLFPQWAMKYPG